MPLSAVAAGCVDFILPPERIAAELARINGHPYLRGVARGADTPERGEEGIRRICTLLRTASGVDFRLYKPATISRRIARRMALRKLDTPEQYAQLLIRDRNELNALYEDIFIHVTGFFRDPERIQALRQAVFARSLSRRRPGHIRVWVPGCSSGEEVYTMAMLLVEQLGERRNQSTVQIFGTDISDRAIEQARAGIYPESSMAGVSRERQRRFFSRVEGGFQIVKSLRDVCVFARHDLAKDPPFSKLDLISCRNVLIYMGPVLQKRVIETFHYALKPNGHLLLGKSESLSSYSNLFSVEDTKHKFFSRRPFSSPLHLSAVPMARPDARTGDGQQALRGRRCSTRAGRPNGFFSSRYAPAAFVVDPRLQIVHFQGNTSRFLAPATGEASFHLLRMVRPELVVALRTAIHQAKKEGAVVRKSGIPVQQDGTSALVDIQVWPLRERRRGMRLPAGLQEAANPEPATAAPARGAHRSEAAPATEMARRDRELAAARTASRHDSG